MAKKTKIIIVIIIGVLIMVICSLIINYNQKSKETELVKRTIQVTVKDEVDESEIDKLKEKISSIKGVDDVELYSKEMALEELKQKLGEDNELIKEYEGEKNIFPNVLYVKATVKKKSTELDEISDEISKLDEVEDVFIKSNGKVDGLEMTENNERGYK